jgi:hypothetical protein
MECAPTVRGEIKKARASQYDIYSALNEFVDNSLDAKARTICIDVREHVENERRIHKILFSDDAPSGISKKNLKDIFSWTYERKRDQTEIGEFGTGFKAASVNIGNKLTVMTRDGEAAYQAIADWCEMSDSNLWVPKILAIDAEFFRSYHPFSTGTTLILEDIRHEFIQRQKGNERFLERLYNELSYSYKYFLKHHPGVAILVRGMDEEREISCAQKNDHMRYFFDQAPLMVQTRVVVYKESSAYHIHLQREDVPYWEAIEFVEKRKNGSNVLRSTHLQPHTGKTIIDTMLFRSCTHYNANNVGVEPEYTQGTVDIVRNHRILARNLTYRPHRSDPHVAFIKHELIYNSKWLNAILGIQFNKTSDGNIPEGDMRYTLEYIQRLHEKEIVRFEKQKLGRVAVREKEEDEYLCLDLPVPSPSLPPSIPVPPPPPIMEITPLEILPTIISIAKPSTIIHKSSPTPAPPTAPTPPTPSPSIPLPTPPTPPLVMTEKRRNFSMETKLEVLKKQECRDVDFDFRLLDDILPLDYDHKNGQSSNNSTENCQALSVISHALKSRRPDVLERHRAKPLEYIVDLLNCITSSRVFIEAYTKNKIHIRKPTDLNRRDGLFHL